MTVKIFALLVSLTAGIAVSAHADELAQDAALVSGNAVAPSYFIAFDALPPLKEIGRSSLRVMVFKVFDSALFTESGDWQDPTKSFRYELTYARTIAGSVLASQTTKEWEHLGFTDERQSGWVEYLEAIWPDVSKGDTITFDVDAAGVSRFYFNGEWLGAVEDPDFAPMFIAIWLSPETSRPAHREGLLAES